MSIPEAFHLHFIIKSIPEAFNVQAFILSFYSGSIRRSRRRRISGYCCSKSLTVQFSPLRDFSVFYAVLQGTACIPCIPGNACAAGSKNPLREEIHCSG